MKCRIDSNRTAAEARLRDLNERQIAAVREGVREAERGRFVSHGRLKAKWVRCFAAALDKAR